MMKMFQFIKWLGRLYDYSDENMEMLAEYPDSILEANQQNVKFDYQRFTSVMLEVHFYSEISFDVNTSYDYYCPLMNMEGLKMLVFNSHDYPDLASGGVVEILLPIQEEVFLQIISTIVHAVDELKLYPVEKRRCIFASERTTEFDSYSDCLTECKMKNILVLCNCIPCYMSAFIHDEFRKQLCTLSDVVCLNKFKSVILKYLSDNGWLHGNIMEVFYLFLEKWMTFLSSRNIKEI